VPTRFSHHVAGVNARNAAKAMPSAPLPTNPAWNFPSPLPLSPRRGEPPVPTPVRFMGSKRDSFIRGILTALSPSLPRRSLTMAGEGERGNRTQSLSHCGRERQNGKPPVSAAGRTEISNDHRNLFPLPFLAPPKSDEGGRRGEGQGEGSAVCALTDALRLPNQGESSSSLPLPPPLLLNPGAGHLSISLL
jgi:hypothetical protein